MKTYPKFLKTFMSTFLSQHIFLTEMQTFYPNIITRISLILLLLQRWPVWYQEWWKQFLFLSNSMIPFIMHKLTQYSLSFHLELLGYWKRQWFCHWCRSSFIILSMFLANSCKRPMVEEYNDTSQGSNKSL